jgi:amino acid transporter
MGRHDFFHTATSKTHVKHATPHIALAVMGLIMFFVVTISRLSGMEVLDQFNDAGTMGAFGFLGAYVLITVAAPFFLKKRGELKAKDVAMCAVALVLMLIPAVGSVYPLPPAPLNYFPYIFGAYLLIGGARVMRMRTQKPQRLEEIALEVQKLHAEAA